VNDLLEKPPTPTYHNWHLVVLVPAASLFVLILARPTIIRTGFGFLLDNLPLTLPVLSVTMAILLDPRGLAAKSGWVKLTPHFALGLVSFAIWYFVASQGAGDYITISQSKVLTKEFSFLLLISAFIWAGYTSVVAIISESRATSSQRWWVLRLANLGLSVALLILPFSLFEDKQSVEKRIGASLDVVSFSVAVPYRDPSLNQYLGRSTDPLTQVFTFQGIRARTHDEARRVAVDSFLTLPESRQFTRPNKRPGTEVVRRAVEVLSAQVVAQATTAR